MLSRFLANAGGSRITIWNCFPASSYSFRMSKELPSRKVTLVVGIQLLIALCRCDRRGRHVNALDVLAIVGHRQGEAALVAEAIENFSGRVSPRRAMILALVEKGSGFLAFQQDRMQR